MEADRAAMGEVNMVLLRRHSQEPLLAEEAAVRTVVQ
jgi:hypothetical protein